MGYRAISLVQKFGLLHEQWQPKVIAEMNDYQFKVVKLQGDFCDGPGCLDSFRGRIS